MTQSPATQQHPVISSETKALSSVVARMSDTIARRGHGPLTSEQRELVEMAYGLLNGYMARKGIAMGDAAWFDVASATYDPWS